MIQGSGSGSIPLTMDPDPDPGGPKTCGSGTATLQCANAVYTVGTQPERTFTAVHQWNKTLMPKILDRTKA
jgi:hypothetical protein